jgi:hypothetical protein
MRVFYYLSVLRAAKISVRAIRANLDVLFATVGSDDRKSLYINGRLPDTPSLSRSQPESLTLTHTHTQITALSLSVPVYLYLYPSISHSLTL